MCSPEKNAAYDVVIRDVTFTNALEEPISPFFTFTVGGKTEKIDNRDSGGGMQEVYTKGPVFETDTQLRWPTHGAVVAPRSDLWHGGRIPPEEMAQYEAEGTMQWFGTYKDLAQEYLKLKCRHRPPSCNKCGFDKFRGHKRVTICSLNKHLKLIASGCVSQSFEIG